MLKSILSVFTGAFGAYLLRLNPRKFSVANVAGVLLAGVAVTALCLLIDKGADLGFGFGIGGLPGRAHGGEGPLFEGRADFNPQEGARQKQKSEKRRAEEPFELVGEGATAAEGEEPSGQQEQRPGSKGEDENRDGLGNDHAHARSEMGRAAQPSHDDRGGEEGRGKGEEKETFFHGGSVADGGREGKGKFCIF